MAGNRARRLPMYIITQPKGLVHRYKRPGPAQVHIVGVLPGVVLAIGPDFPFLPYACRTGKGWANGGRLKENMSLNPI